MNKFTEHLEKVGDKFRIRETFSATPITSSSVTEKVIVEGKEVKAHKKYTVRIWDKNFNANGRNYSNVIDEIIKNKYITDGLADHPNDGEDSVKDICFVEKNPRMIDGWMCVDVYPVGEYGRKIEEILDVGGGIEVSSSILGDIDNDGYVFDATLERYADWVRNCSNRQIHYSDHIEQREDDNKINLVSEEGCVQETKESNEENLTILEENSVVKVGNTDNAIEKNIGENTMENMALNEKVAEQVKSSLKLNIKSMIKEAKSKSDLYEKKEILESANLYAKQLDDKSITEEIDNELSATEKELKELSVKGLETDGLNDKVAELTKANNELTEKLKKAEDDKSEVKEQLDVVTEMYESKQYKASKVELERNHNLAKEVCSLKIKAKKLESKIEMLTRKNAILENRARKAEHEVEITEAKLNTMIDADSYSKLLNEKENVTSELRKFRVNNLRKKENTDDRLANLKRRLNKVDNEVAEDETNVPSTTEEDDEDLKMEAMMGMNFEKDSTPTQFDEEDDEDSFMEKAISGKLN